MLVPHFLPIFFFSLFFFGFIVGEGENASVVLSLNFHLSAVT